MSELKGTRCLTDRALLQVIHAACENSSSQVGSQSADAAVITMDADEILRDRFRGTRLCSECVEEPDLQNYIASADGAPGCSFCECDDAPTCEFLDFMEHVRECIEAEYDLAANCLTWESAEGGWQFGSVWNTYELILDELQVGLARADSDELLKTMMDCLGHHDWCVRDPYGEHPLDALRFRWQEFRYLIKHRTRFFLDRWAPPLSDGSLGARHPPTPAAMLSAIGDRIQRLELIQNFPAGRSVYRARYCKNDHLLRTPNELGPAPPELAVVANRMSPPGIVMFYAAHDSETALAETATGPGRFSVGKFAVHRSCGCSTLRTCRQFLASLTQYPTPSLGVGMMRSSSASWYRT